MNHPDLLIQVLGILKKSGEFYKLLSKESSLNIYALCCLCMAIQVKLKLLACLSH